MSISKMTKHASVKCILLPLTRSHPSLVLLETCVCVCIHLSSIFHHSHQCEKYPIHSRIDHGKIYLVFFFSSLSKQSNRLTVLTSR